MTRQGAQGRGAALAAVVLLAVGCATPVGVSPDSPRAVQRELFRSALVGDVPSARTIELLTRLDLVRSFDRDPEATLATLHAGLAPEGDLDRLFALAELSFLHGERARRPDHSLAAAIYAFAFLFGEDPFPPAHSFDPRLQIARNLYNRGLTQGLAIRRERNVRIENHRYSLPFGTLDVVVSPGTKSWFGWELEDFVAAADFRVRGLTNRYRHAGIGAPLTAGIGARDEANKPPGAVWIPPRLRVPVTAFLRIANPRAALRAEHLTADLELHSGDDGRELEVAGAAVPLELERSSSLAFMLEGSQIWSLGILGFRLGDFVPSGNFERLVMLHPYQPGRIPLVLVHGTFSQPATWAQLVNELQNEPAIATRYQIWLFVYNSGNPVAYSGGLLVETLRRAVEVLDPTGQDAALHRMVVAGHSQGGLLTRLTGVESGDAFWRNISRRPIDALDLEPENRALLERSLFFEPLPFVERLIFLATPHRGSYLADFRVASWISRLVKAPARIASLTLDLARHGSDEFFLQSLDRPPTSLDNMASRNPFLRTLAELPTDPRIRTHSIIGVRGHGPPERGGDGVVSFRSASIDGVDSELVVRSGHGVHETQPAIQEVRRILLEHADVGPVSAPDRSSELPSRTASPPSMPGQ